MTPSSSSTSQPPSFATAALSNAFTFTVLNIKPICAPTSGELPHDRTFESSAILKTSDSPTISLCSTFNATAPANHLPTELVIKILTSGAWNQWRELVPLTRICQHWRNVALGTPQLWADAAQSAFADPDDRGWNFRCLSIFLARSGSCPLRIDLPWLSRLTWDLEEHDDPILLEPHLARVAHLSAQLLNITEFVEFVGVHGLRMRNLESFFIPQVKRTFLGDLLVIDANKLRIWRDTDFPRLRTLTISAYCFVRQVAVASLKDLVLHDEPRTYEEFLYALDRCAAGLESLTLRGWSHPSGWAYRVLQNPSKPVIQLPNLHRFRVSLSSHSTNTNPLAFLFAWLSLPPDVSIHLDWKCNPGDAHQLLPKHLSGLQVAPFFDALCLHIFAVPYTTSMHCFVGDAQRLCVRERPFHPRFPDGRGLSDFLDEHRHPAVTRLAVDFEMDLDSRKGYTGRMASQVDAFRAFVRGLPNLYRLDLLGNGPTEAKLEFAKAFLFLGLSDSARSEPAPNAPPVGRTLGYVCGEYGDDGSTGASIDFASDLTRIEQLLKAHQAAGGVRLRMLEICAADPSRAADAHVTSRPVYPYTHDIPASREAARSLALRYELRFRALVDEVVFIGHTERLGLGIGYRILPGKAAAVCQPVPGPGLRQSKSRGRGRRLGVH